MSYADLFVAHRAQAISRRRFSVGLTVGAALAVAGPWSRSASAAAKPGGTLIAAFSADPAGFDPQRGPSGMSHVVIEQVYSTLMALDPDAKPYPELAESHEVSDDGLTYTFKLRKDVEFRHEDYLTADSAKST